MSSFFNYIKMALHSLGKEKGERSYRLPKNEKKKKKKGERRYIRAATKSIRTAKNQFEPSTQQFIFPLGLGWRWKKNNLHYYFLQWYPHTLRTKLVETLKYMAAICGA